ncbi:IS256 family transposase [Blastopirellula retiformator]|uniref:Mutator family transposase n=1 Tax=Blastopirellula retiformator TaxID=2527970 RepID=A0A5C5VL81_9BACT|nr:IS256 family transposase [Blastopirellula retiformator]TWT38757.1 Transposase, Mutator family [Blastopirellula retiformator]
MIKIKTDDQATPVGEQDNSATISLAAFSDQKSPLDELVREGARRMLQAAIDAFVAQHQDRRDEQGRRLVIKNGSLPQREILTGAGAIPVTQGRVRDNTTDPQQRVSFTPSVLPTYLRKTAAIEELIPWLYLKGVSTGDFGEALQSLVGEKAAGLSANVVVRLKEQWGAEYDEWSKRDLSDKHYVYVWADGIHAKVRLEDDANKKQCLLVLMGATADGQKELIAVLDGYRESEQSWHELLIDLKQRGLAMAPKIAVGDGALGFWAALRKVFPETQEQRCWVHKTANVLNKLPKSVQPKAKADLHEIWQAETKQTAEKSFDEFLEKYKAKYSAACECLRKDRDVLLTFYDFPAEHWGHLRTTNPIESTFATIRLRHRRTKGNGTRRASLTMMFKLAQSAAKKWRRLNCCEKLSLVLEGRSFQDGILQGKAA